MVHTIGDDLRRPAGTTEQGHSLTDILRHPLPGRPVKPRSRGLTMIIDQGLGLSTLVDCLRLGAEYIDFVKLAYGTSGLYPPELLREKIAFIRDYGVDVYPGGTAFEVAHYNGRGLPYLDAVRELGFSAVEISDGTIALAPAARRRYIAAARDRELTVLTEVGKKQPDERLSSEARCARVMADLETGADRVILEGRTSGRDIGVYDANGRLREDDAVAVRSSVPDPDVLIWEAPTKRHQVALLSRFGSQVNLGNVAYRDVMALEAMRVGLRGDTFRTAVQPTVQ